jgi:hypothetical protein
MIGIARWLFTVLGGLLVGGGLTLHGQVALARHLREEVDGTFFLWRAIGEATFYFQGAETRMALAMAEVPEEALVHSDRAAWALLIVGALIAVTAPLLGRGRPASAASSPRGA